MWHMQSCSSCWRGILISTADWHAWEYNEKNDVQKLKKHVKSKSAVGKESVKKIKAHWTQGILMEQSSMSTAISR